MLIMSKFYFSAVSKLTVCFFLLLNLVSTQVRAEVSHEQGFFTVKMQQLQQVVIRQFQETKILTSDFTTSANAFVAPAFMTQCSGAAGELGGKAFGDFNYDGAEDSGAVGLPNVKVYIFGCDVNGTSFLADSTVTDNLGQYTFTGLTDGDKYRVEFYLPSYLEDLKQYTEGGSNATQNVHATQFATVPSCQANAGFAYTEDYYGTNPYVIASCFVNGNTSPITPPVDPDENPANEKTVVWFHWDDQNFSPSPVELANGGETGAVYGLAHNRYTNKVYASAFIKRHTGLGPLGLGGIYQIDITDINNPVVSNFLNVTTLGVNVGSIGDNVSRGLPDNSTEPSNDATAFDKVAKEGIGALDIDELTNTLYFVNLFDRKLYSIALDSDNDPSTAPTSADVTSYTLPADPCTNGTFRPFAVNVHRSQVYVGGNCDAATGTSADLAAYIYRLDGTSFTQVATADLSYTKGYAATENNCDNYPGWYPWQSTLVATCSGNGDERIVYPTPVLADMKFDVDGSLILGLMDRTGHQIGYKNYPITGTTPLISAISGGDIIRLHNNEGTFVQETNGTAGSVTTAGAGNAQGNGGGEYYFMDVFAGPSDNVNPPPHAETAQGDLAAFPGSGEIAVTSLDPYSTLYNSGGVNYFNNGDGSVRPAGYVLYSSSTSDISNFSKGNGLGGLVTLGTTAPLNVGGITWKDSNADGIQDACEDPLSDINVSLYNAAGMVVATTITNSFGQWSFDQSVLELNTDYYAVFGGSGQFDDTDGSLLDSLYITENNVGMGFEPDRNDSDIVMTASGVANDAFRTYPSIAFQTGSYGYVNHNLDAGFSLDNLNPIAGIGGVVFSDLDNDGIQDGGTEVGIDGVIVTLYDNNDNIVGVDTTDSTGSYYFPNLPMGTYYVNVDYTNTGDNYDFSPQDAGSDDSVDSDVNVTTGNSGNIAFDPVNGDSVIDAGLAPPTGTISGTVWNDLDMDGIQDSGDEVGIEGVTVYLYEDGNSVAIATTTTDASGNYSFNDVTAGDYFVDFDPTTNTDNLAGLEGSPQDQGGNESADSDADANAGETDVFTFAPETDDTADLDAGFFQPTGMISGTVFNDQDTNGLNDNGDTDISNVIVKLLDSDNNVIQTDTTDASGNYAFTGVLAGSYTVMFNSPGSDFNPTTPNSGTDDSIDSDIDTNGMVTITDFDPNTSVVVDAGYQQDVTTISGVTFMDTNENGLQDANETNISNVQVILYDSDNNVIDTEVTNAAGGYLFTGVVSGDYYVSFNPGNAGIVDFTYSSQDQGTDDTIDSDVNTTSGNTATFTVDATNGDPITNLDAGLIFDNATLGGFAFFDCNKNGVLDAGEVYLSNVPVTLVGQDMSGNTQSFETTTDADGNYLFTNIRPGTYTLTFNTPEVPTGLSFTTTNQGTDDTIDSDVNTSNGAISNFSIAAGAELAYSAGFIDSEAPTFDNMPADEDVSCGSPEFGTAPMVTASDNITGTPTVTYEETMETVDGECSGIVISRTWTATDDCGNTSQYTQTLNAVDNTPPVLSFVNPALMGLMDGDTMYFDCNEVIPVNGAEDAVATDVCDDNPTVTFEDFLITEGDCAENGHIRQLYCGWIATDDCGNSDTFDIYMVVRDIQAPMLIGNIPTEDIEITCADPIPGAPIVTATDNCTENVQLEFDEVVLGDTCDVVKIIRKWTATDDCGNMTMQQYSIFIRTPELEINGVPDNANIACTDLQEPPVITLSHECHDPVIEYDETLIGTICEDHKINRKWTVTNSCGQTAVEQYTLTVDVPELAIQGVPEDVTVSCDDVPEPATPTVDDSCYDINLTFNELIFDSVCDTFTIQRIWTATDECGNVVEESQTITVLTPELALLGIPTDVTIACTEDLPPIASPTTPTDCYETTIDYGETVIGDTCSNYKILRVWVANDFCGNQVMGMQTIIVEVPELAFVNPPQNATYECDDEIPDPVNPMINTDCYETEVTFVGQQIIPGACENEFTIERNWTASDACGNVITHQQVITVIDTVAPVVTVTHPDLSLISSGDTLYFDCSELVNFNNAVANATDNCTDEVDIEFTEVNEIGDCSTDGYIFKMDCCWTATDPCNNSTEFCFTAIIRDTEAPILSGVPDDLVVNLADGDTVPAVANVTATDACADPTLSFTEYQETGDCGYTITRTWTAIDDCGNAVTETQTIVVNDICDCPNIVVTNVNSTNSNCGQNNGTFSVMTSVSPNVYDFVLLPNYGNANAAGNEVTNLPPGSYLMIVSLPGVEDCDEKIYFDIVEEGCTGSLTAEITNAPTTFCIPESAFSIDGVITSTAICNAGNIYEVTATNLDGTCMTLLPTDGFTGTASQTICVTTCFNGSTTNCETTNITVNVTATEVPCELAMQNIQLSTDECGQNTGSISFEVTGAQGALSYNWSPNVSITNAATNLAAGVYNVTVIDAATACTQTATYNVEATNTNGTLTQDAVTVTPSSCVGTSEGSIASTSSEVYAIYNATNELLGNTPLTGLMAGDYRVEKNTGECTESITVTVGGVEPITITPAVSNVTCEGADGAITLTVEGGAAGEFTYFWSPNVSAANTATGLFAGSYDVTVMDSQGCTAEMGNIIVLNSCNECILQYDITTQNVQCANATNGSITINTANTYNYAWSHDATLTTNVVPNLGVGVYVVTITDPNDATCLAVETIAVAEPTAMVVTDIVTNETCEGNDGTITLNVVGGQPTYTFTWIDDVSTTASATGLSAGIYGVTVGDQNDCQTVLSYMVTDDCNSNNACENIFELEYDVITSNACESGIPYCLDERLSNVASLELTINGVPYNSQMSNCNYTTVFAYTYVYLPGAGQSGPYTITDWTINGIQHTGTFQTLDAMIYFMNNSDVNGSWELDATYSIIRGGNPVNAYGNMQVTQDATGQTITLAVQSFEAPTGTQIYVQEGENRIVATDQDGCSDTLNVTVTCLTTETVNVSTVVGMSGIYCPDLSELPSGPYTVAVNCVDCSNVSIIAENECVSYTGLSVGQGTAEIIVCNEDGICDQTNLIIDVTQINGPIANNDAYLTPINVPILMRVMDNDTIVGGITSLGLQRAPDRGIVDVNFDNTLYYTPENNYCGEQTFTYYICNEIDCDQAEVLVKVECDQPHPVSGFSPNGDGVNETFMIAGIAQYEHTLTVFNRQGLMVYTSNDYKSDWKGTWNGDMLPDGTYFYILNYDDGKKMTGYVQIKR